MTSESPSGPARVAVFGLGYVGSVTAACLAHLGHRVVGTDMDEFKVQSIHEGRAPFYEPGLDALIVEGAGKRGQKGAEVAQHLVLLLFLLMGSISQSGPEQSRARRC